MSSDPPTSFLEELKRRKVVRAAVVYGAVAFAVVEAADVMFPRIPLPEWTVALVVWMAILGFPLALALAWAFDVTPEGVERAGSGRAPEAAGRRWLSARSAVLAVGFLSLGLTAGWWAGRGEAPAAGEAAGSPSRSVAVLPFANMSGDEENLYFSDGLAEEILNVLARVDGLKVAARTSSFAYRGEGKDIRQIGDELDVGTVLEGSVRRADDRVRVTAQLIQTADGFHLWSESYDRQLDDIFRIQEEVAQQIVQALRVELGMEVERAVERQRPTDDLEAYQFFLQARHLFHQRTEESLYRSVELYEEALKRDPDFAEAHVGLAMTYTVLPGYAEPAFDARTRAREAVERGLELNPSLVQGHAVRGNLARDAGDFIGAHGGYQRALEIDPSDPSALLWNGILQLVAGRIEAGDSLLSRARERDPASGVVTGWIGHLAVLRGDHDRALQLYRRSMDLTWGAGKGWLCAMALAAGKWEEVRAECADAADVSELERDALDRLERLALASDPETREGLLGEMGDYALLYAPILDDADIFFSALGDFSLDGALSLSHISIWRPEAADFRRDPRFAAWVEAVGLPEYWDRTSWPGFCSRTDEGEIRCN